MAIIKNSKLLIIIFLLIIIGIASFFRLWQLDSVPPGFYPDVAMNGTDVLQSLHDGHLELFYPNNNGREGLFMWLIAGSFWIFGVSVWSLKFTAAIIGIFTVLGTYLLAKELFKKVGVKYLAENNEHIALLSSFLLAVSFWHVNLSRIGFRAIMLPLILVFSFYFLFKGLNNKKIRDFIIAGIIFGAGFYTYTSFRVAPAILIFLLIPCLFYFRKENLQKKYLIFVSVFLFFAFIVALPLGLYFLHHSQDFISRATPISVFAAENPAVSLLKSSVLHLGMFNFYGDPNWRHNFAGHPMLPLPLGILFLIGLFYSFVKIRGNFIIFGFLISFWLVMLLPGILTYEGIPHSLRVIGVIPAVYILTAIGGWWVYEKVKNIVKNQKIVLAICFVFLIAIASAEFHKYFYLWSENPNVARANTLDYANIGNHLNSLTDNVQKYVIINEPGSPIYGISIAAQTPMFIEAAKFGKPRANYITFENLNPADIDGKNSVIIPLYPEKTLPELAKKFPQGNAEKINNFWTYNISE
ncbi:MAG: glycosyltransferase family 39 protein [Patescibacteria group bacterium]